MRLPGTLEVSTVCTVGGGAAGVTEVCAGVDWVGLGGCIEPTVGPWTTPELVTGINPLGGGVGATTFGILWPGTAPNCDGRVPAAPATGGIGW